jgi:D-aminoacyl-tRNA deacylase
MRAVVQRVKSAHVTIEGETVGAIGHGVLVLLGIAPEDGSDHARWLADKITNLRIFNDDDGKMNRSLSETGGSALIVSQFTLYGDARKGRRPSFIRAAQGAEAEAVYEDAIEAVRSSGIECASGRFGAVMEVGLVNEGPVTILLDSEKAF